MDALGIARATIVGHCMGSIVGQCMAAMAPSRVSRLVLAASCASTRLEPVLQLREIVGTLEDPVPLDFIVDFQTSTVHQAPPQEFLSTVFRESSKLPARVWKSVLAEFLNAEPDPAAIRCPALLLWGDRDSSHSRSRRRCCGRSPIPGCTWRMALGTRCSGKCRRPSFAK